MPLPATSTLLAANAGFALMSAALWGGGDFVGSISVKRGGGTVRVALTVVVIGHLLSLCTLLLLAPHFDGSLSLPHLEATRVPLLISAAGGLVSGLALVAFYVALASGHMGSAAAVSGLICAAIPAAVSALTEGTPGWRKLLGFLLAGAAIWLIASSGEAHERADRRAMLLSIAGGVGFGIYFVALKQGGAVGVLWPTAAARVGSLTVCSLLLAGMLLRGRLAGTPPAVRLDLRTVLLIAAGAGMDTGGNLSFVAASRLGRLDVAAVLASLYPAGTILLAAALLRERTSGQQRWGMLLALPAVVLITL